MLKKFSKMKKESRANYNMSTITAVISFTVQALGFVHLPGVSPNAFISFWSQFYKSFYGRKLQIFVIIYRVCPQQGFNNLFYYLWAKPGAYPIVEHLKGSSVGQAHLFQQTLDQAGKPFQEQRLQLIAPMRNLRP